MRPAIIRSLALLILCVGSAACKPALPKPQAESFVLPAVRLVEPALGRSAPLDLVVSDGTIQAGDAAADAPAALDDYAGATVLPGLVDMHTHLPPETPLGLTQ